MNHHFRSSAWASDPAGYVRGIRCRRCGFDQPHPIYFAAAGICFDCAPATLRRQPGRRVAPRRNHKPAPPSAAEQLAAAEVIAALPPREKQIARALAAGRSQRGLAKELSLVPQTVGSSYQRIKAKFKARGVKWIQLVWRP